MPSDSSLLPFRSNIPKLSEHCLTPVDPTFPERAKAEGGAQDYVVRGRAIGGFAVVAYPAKYASSGIMTFIVNQDGVVYERDLGPKTSERAGTIALFDPDKNWEKADMTSP